MKFKAVSVFIVLTFISLQAQDAPTVGHIARFGGGVGYTPVLFFSDLSVLNKQLTPIGFPELDSKVFYASGGAGYVYFLIENLRIGAFGYSGGLSETNTSNGFNNEVIYNLSNLGFSIEYTLPYFDGFGVSAGVLIGGGSVEIEFYKNSGNYTWNSIFNEVQNGSNNINKKLSNSFFSLTPTLNVDIPINRFLFFRVGGGYQYTIGDTWEIDNGIEVSSVPSGVNGNGFYLQTGLFIGLVTY